MSIRKGCKDCWYGCDFLDKAVQELKNSISHHKDNMVICQKCGNIQEGGNIASCKSCGQLGAFKKFDHRFLFQQINELTKDVKALREGLAQQQKHEQGLVKTIEELSTKLDETPQPSLPPFFMPADPLPKGGTKNICLGETSYSLGPRQQKLLLDLRNTSMSSLKMEQPNSVGVSLRRLFQQGLLDIKDNQYRLSEVGERVAKRLTASQPNRKKE